MKMAECIERSTAIKAAKHAWAKGLEPSQYIEVLPAADVAPVVHGRWGDDGSGIIICSECGKGYSLIPRYTHYCPNCGAKMDGGDNDAAD